MGTDIGVLVTISCDKPRHRFEGIRLPGVPRIGDRIRVDLAEGPALRTVWAVCWDTKAPSPGLHHYHRPVEIYVTTDDEADDAEQDEVQYVMPRPPR